jgi:hypothetical protein
MFGNHEITDIHICEKHAAENQDLMQSNAEKIKSFDHTPPPPTPDFDWGEVAHG